MFQKYLTSIEYYKMKIFKESIFIQYKIHKLKRKIKNPLDLRLSSGFL